MKDNKIFDFSRKGFQDIINTMTKKINECVDVSNGLIPTLDDYISKVDWNKIINSELYQKVLGDLDKTKEQLDNVMQLKNISVIRISGELDDTEALKRAINKCNELKGGLIQFSGVLEVSKNIIINSKYINIKGLGENSVIKYVGDNEIKSVLTFDCGDWYGLRHTVVEGITVDGNNKAKHCYLIGDTAPVVEGTFKRLIAKNSTDYGFVLDCTQNSYFELLNTFNCGGGVALLNGAGNNTFTRCDISNILTKESFYFNVDTNYNCHKVNIFGNAPSNNKFYDCISEECEGTYFINCVNGKRNLFHKLELAIKNNSQCIKFDTSSQYNEIDKCNISYNSKTFIPIISNGFYNSFNNILIENCQSPTTIQVTNRTKLNNLTLTASLQKNYVVSGDYLMLEVDRGNLKRLESTSTLFPATLVDKGVFYFNDNNEIGFAFKNKSKKIITEDVGQTLFFTGSQVSQNLNLEFTLPSTGVYVAKVYVLKGDQAMGYYSEYAIVYNNARSVISEKFTPVKFGFGHSISQPSINGEIITIPYTNDVSTSWNYKIELHKELFSNS